MRSRAFIITAAVLTVLLVAVGGVYAYDQSGRDHIPKGVRIAGIDVGGLDAAAARARLEQRYLPELEAPVRVYHGNDTFVLTAAESKVATNIGAMVDNALAEVHTGNLFTRSFRRLTGGRLNVDLSPETTYDKGAVVRYPRPDPRRRRPRSDRRQGLLRRRQHAGTGGPRRPRRPGPRPAHGDPPRGGRPPCRPQPRGPHRAHAARGRHQDDRPRVRDHAGRGPHQLPPEALQGLQARQDLRRSRSA